MKTNPKQAVAPQPRKTSRMRWSLSCATLAVELIYDKTLINIQKNHKCLDTLSCN